MCVSTSWRREPDEERHCINKSMTHSRQPLNLLGVFLFYRRDAQKQTGLLGTFPKGSMVPPFDKVCFDPATPVGTTVGPVLTQFGYHLIYIHDRKIPEVVREKVVRC